MKFIIGKKMAMTQLWDNGTKVMAVTPVKIGPCTVVQIKSTSKDGYNALQLAFGSRKEKNINKPQKGHLKKLGLFPEYLREFRTEEVSNFKVGDIISMETFIKGDKVNVTGTSKGKGFQGVVKRHGFHGFKKTHGNKDQERMPGSIGSKGPAHVFKGKKMAGRMGNTKTTVSNLEVIEVDKDQEILFIKGALPGAINSLVLINGQGDLKVDSQIKKEDKMKIEEGEKGEKKEVKEEEIKNNKTETEKSAL